MTVQEFIIKLARTAKTKHVILSENMIDDNHLISLIKENMRKGIDYSFIFEKDILDHPIITMLGWEVVREPVKEFLEKNHPGAWFLPMYYSLEE